MLKLKVPVLLIQKGTGILKVLGSGSFRKSWVLLDYNPLVHYSCRCNPWLPQVYQKQMYTSIAFPRKKIMKSKPLSSEYLHARHSSGSRSRDSPGPLDKQSWSGVEFKQISVLLSPNLLKANHNIL